MTEKELELILQEGEGYRLEFKESMKNFDKEIVAFANASGGRLLMGVSDDCKVTGITIDNQVKSRIQDIAANCKPSIDITIEEFKNILVIHVKEGKDKPYKCTSGFYTRIGPNSQRLDRDAIISFIKSEGKARYDEMLLPKFDSGSHYDAKKLDRFLKLAGVSKVLEDDEILLNLGAAERQEGNLIFNNTGVLFFAKNLADIYFHTAVTCALYKGTEKVEILDRRDFNEDLIGNISGALNFLKQYIPVRYEITGAPKRKEIPEIPYEALREAVINSVAHRDYFEKGSNVMVEMFDDRIEITNFGGLVTGLKPEDFGKRSILRNPNIANLLHRSGYIEKMGTGISRMRKIIEKAGLPPIRFEFSDFFTVIFTRVQGEGIRTAPGAANGKSNGGGNSGHENGFSGSRWIDILNQLRKDEGQNVSQLTASLGVSKRTLERDLAALKKKNFILFRGSPRTGGYFLTPTGLNILSQLGV